MDEVVVIKALVISADRDSSKVIASKLKELGKQLKPAGKYVVEVTRIIEAELDDELRQRDPDLSAYRHGVLVTDHTMAVYDPDSACRAEHITLGHSAIRNRVRQEYWKTRDNPLSASEGERIARRALQRVVKHGV